MAKIGYKFDVHKSSEGDSNRACYDKLIKALRGEDDRFQLMANQIIKQKSSLNQRQESYFDTSRQAGIVVTNPSSEMNCSVGPTKSNFMNLEIHATSFFQCRECKSDLEKLSGVILANENVLIGEEV